MANPRQNYKSALARLNTEVTRLHHARGNQPNQILDPFLASMDKFLVEYGPLPVFLLSEEEIKDRTKALKLLGDILLNPENVETNKNNLAEIECFRVADNSAILTPNEKFWASFFRVMQWVFIALACVACFIAQGALTAATGGAYPALIAMGAAIGSVVASILSFGASAHTNSRPSSRHSFFNSTLNLATTATSIPNQRAP